MMLTSAAAVLMASPSPQVYSAACGRLASVLGISLASARRRVDIQAARNDIRDTSGKVALAQKLLDEAESSDQDNHTKLTSLLEAVGSDEHFMVED
jgi:hypothetical protein